jgi:hypothetical protein
MQVDLKLLKKLAKNTSWIGEETRFDGVYIEYVADQSEFLFYYCCNRHISIKVCEGSRNVNNDFDGDVKTIFLRTSIITDLCKLNVGKRFATINIENDTTLGRVLKADGGYMKCIEPKWEYSQEEASESLARIKKTMINSGKEKEQANLLKMSGEQLDFLASMSKNGTLEIETKISGCAIAEFTIKAKDYNSKGVIGLLMGVERKWK